MLSTVKALSHALSYYLQIKARRVDLDMLWECMSKEDDMQAQLFDMSAEGLPAAVIELHAAKLRVVSKARRSIQERLQGDVGAGQADNEGVVG